MTKQKIYPVALLGMNDKGLSTFVYFIRKQANQYLKLDTPANADVYIVDFDTEIGISAWHEYCRVTNKPAILLSVEDPNKPNTVWVKKPVASQELLAAIPRLLKGLESPIDSADTTEKVKKVVEKALDISSKEKKTNSGYQREFTDDFSPNLTLSKDEIAEYCGIREDISIHNNRFEADALFSDEKALLQTLKKAIQLAKDKSVIVFIEGLSIKLAVLGDTGRTFVDLNNRHLRHICAMTMQIAPTLRTEKLSVETVKAAFAMPLKEMPTLDQVLWHVTLWTARGRLIKPLKADHAMQLAHWPNFTRLPITPYAMQIAALWTSQQATPLEIADTLQIPQRYVFALASAAYEVGLLEQKETVNSLMNIKWTGKNNLFNSILRSLKFA